MANDSTHNTHSGVDLIPVDGTGANISDQEVYSVCDGTITGIGTDVAVTAGWGYYLCVRSTADLSKVFCYCHLKNPPTAHPVGSSIGAREAIQLEGGTGHVTGDHLHFQIDEYEFTRGIIPTNIWAHTADPWKYIPPPVSGSPFPADTFSYPVHVSDDWTQSSYGGSAYWQDNNYADNVRTWAKGALTGQGAIVSYSVEAMNFLVAISMTEVGDVNNATFGGHFAEKWNYGNVMSNGKYDTYEQMSDSIAGFKNYFAVRADTQKDFINYLNNWTTFGSPNTTNDFNPSYAASLLIDGGYKGDPGAAHAAGYDGNLIIAYGTASAYTASH